MAGSRVTIALLGHIDSGKSTVIGHLLQLCGAVGQAALSQCAEDSTRRGEVKYAWILDHTEEERHRGMTIQLSYHKLQTQLVQLTFINIPGHRNFIKTMICGAHMSDVGLLVVSASRGEFEVGIRKDGQTREHPLLAFTNGIKQMICCVNKMDEVAWDQSRFEEVVKETSDFLRKVGYNTANVPFIPASGLLGDNLLERSNNMPWFTGPTLFEACRVQPPSRTILKPLRMVVQAAYTLQGTGTVVVGRVHTGSLRVSQAVSIAPALIETSVCSIQIHGEEVDTAVSGDLVAFRPAAIDCRLIRRGMVVSDLREDPARECCSFLGHVIVLNHPGEIKVGYMPVLHCHMASVACRLVEILSKINRRSGAIIEERPGQLKTGDAAICKFVPMKAICVEAFTGFPAMGRFALRDMQQTVAVGVVKEVKKLNMTDEGWRVYGKRRLVG